MPMWKRYTRLLPLARILCVLGFLAVVLWLHTSYQAKRNYARGELARQRHQYMDAIQFFERAIKQYIPFSTLTPRVLQQLWDLGMDAEQQGDLLIALEAFGAIRSSLFAVQSTYLPYRHWIPKTEKRLAVLMARTTQLTQQDTQRLARDTARFTRLLQRNTTPGLAGTVLMEIGFLGWVGTTVGFIWHFSTRYGIRAIRQRLVWGGGMMVCFAMWIVGMLLA